MYSRDCDEAAELLTYVDYETPGLNAWRLRMARWVETLRGGDAVPFRDSLVALVDAVPQITENFKLDAAEARILAGDEEAGWELLRQFVEEAQASGDVGRLVGAQWDAASVYARYGREQEAFAALDEAVARPMRAGTVYGLYYLELWLAWDPLRDDPRFDDLLARQAAYEEEPARLADEQEPWPP